MITGAGDLPVRHVIHTVGPMWSGGGHGEPELLASAHRRTVEVAAAHGCARIALPAISCGVYGYPVEQAGAIAVASTREAMAAHPEVVEARFWLFDERTYAAFSAAL